MKVRWEAVEGIPRGGSRDIVLCDWGRVSEKGDTKRERDSHQYEESDRHRL